MVSTTFNCWSPTHPMSSLQQTFGRPSLVQERLQGRDIVLAWACDAIPHAYLPQGAAQHPPAASRMRHVPLFGSVGQVPGCPWGRPSLHCSAGVGLS